MRSKTADFFEIKVRYLRTTEEGCQKSVAEVYALEAFDFTESEERILKEVGQLASGDMYVKTIARAPYKEIFFSDADTMINGIVQNSHSLPLTKRRRERNGPTLSILCRQQLLTRLANT